MNLSDTKFGIKEIIELGLPERERLILSAMLNEKDLERLEKLSSDMIEEREEFHGFDGNTTGGRKEKKRIIELIKCEFYKFSCTDNPIYSSERDQIGKAVTVLIPLLASAIAGSIGILVGLVTGLVASLIMLILKMGKNAFCIKNLNICNSY